MGDDVALVISRMEYLGDDRVCFFFEDVARPSLAPVKVTVELDESGGSLDDAINLATDVAVEKYTELLTDYNVGTSLSSSFGSGPRAIYTGKLSRYAKKSGSGKK